MQNNSDETIIGVSLGEQLEGLRDSNVPYVFVPPFDDEIISRLDPEEQDFLGIFLEAAEPIARIYQNYPSREEIGAYQNWGEFYGTQVDETARVVDVLMRAADYAEKSGKLSYWTNYLRATAESWIYGYHREDPNNIEAERLWALLPADRKFDVRIQPGLEQYRYTFSDGSGYDASMNIRIGEAVQNTHEMTMIQNAVLYRLGAQDVFDNFNVVVRNDHFLIGAGLHGYPDISSAPKASQYKVVLEDGKVCIIVNSNHNVQALDAEAQLRVAEIKFTPEFYRNARRIVGNTLIELYGHEITEAIVEHLNPDAANRLGREPIELLATLIPLEGLHEKAMRGDDNWVQWAQMYRDLATRLVVKFAQRLDGPIGGKGNVYRRGYRIFMDELILNDALDYDKDKIAGINWAAFQKVLHNMNSTLISVIEKRDTAKCRELFALADAA